MRWQLQHPLAVLHALVVVGGDAVGGAQRDDDGVVVRGQLDAVEAVAGVGGIDDGLALLAVVHLDAGLDGLHVGGVQRQRHVVKALLQQGNEIQPLDLSGNALCSDGKVCLTVRDRRRHGQVRAHFTLIAAHHALIQSHAVQLFIQQHTSAGAGAAVENGNVPPRKIAPAADLLGIAGSNVKALSPVGDVDERGGYAGQQLFHKRGIEVLFRRVIQMTGRRVHTPFVQGEQSLKAVEIDPLRREAALVQIVCQNIQHNVLPGNHKSAFLLRRVQERAVHLDPFDGLHALFMAGAGDVGVHVILRKADLSADLVGIDLAAPDQLINRGFADVEDVGDLLRGKRFVLCQRITPSKNNESGLLK